MIAYRPSVEQTVLATCRRRGAIALAFAVSVLVWTCATLVVHAQAPATRPGATRTPREVYEASCMSCHGPDGRGQPQSVVGFDIPLPDFTDCAVATAEADPNWHALAKNGGRSRGFARNMPAFGDVLSDEEIDAAIRHIRTFCTERAWPQGDLNLPRPLVTEKAFPENEAVVTTSIEKDAVGNVFIYEHRLGARGQYEVVVPFNVQQGESGDWARGLGDLAVAAKRALYASLDKGSIFSAGGEVTFPTGKEDLGLGGGATILEPFATYSQMLPRDGFLHVQGGLEFPRGLEGAHDEWYWRTAAGWSLAQNGGTGRTWSPMMELLAARELGAGEPVLWDLVPQMQVTLSKRQHIMMSGGFQFPVNEREGRSKKFMLYLLWDWFDGGLRDGW